MAEWISVKDRLPEEGKETLWYGDESFEIGHVLCSHGVTFVSTWCGRFNLDEYTHWMPLPEAPKEE